MPGKAARHHEITRLLAERRVRSQEELARLLAQRGIEVTQATLSRDLKTLGVVKSPAGYAMPNGEAPAHADETTLVRAIGRHVASVETAGNLVVLRTGPGHAQPVGLALDTDAGATLGGVVGTIAGDDTVFIAAPSPRHANGLADRLREWAGIERLSRKGA